MIPLHRKVARGRAVKSSWDELKLILDSKETMGGSITILVGTLEAYSKVSIEASRSVERVYYVIEGFGKVVLSLSEGEERVFIGKGDTLYVPPGIAHTIYNTGDGRLTLLIMLFPIRALRI